MKVAANAVIEDGITVVGCDYGGCRVHLGPRATVSVRQPAITNFTLLNDERQ